MRNLIDRLQELWCVTMHTATMWPIHGSYRCGTCLREYPVGFEATSQTRGGSAPAEHVFLTQRHRDAEQAA